MQFKKDELMLPITDLVNKYHHIYLEEEAIEAEFRFKTNESKIPKDIGYNEEQQKVYYKIYKDLDEGKINESQAISKLIYLMEIYYEVKYL